MGYNCWSAAENTHDQWVAVDLQRDYVISAVQTKSCAYPGVDANDQAFVTAYTVEYWTLEDLEVKTINFGSETRLFTADYGYIY